MTEDALKYPQWQEPLQKLFLDHVLGTTDKVASVQDMIQSRLRLMTSADAEERQALEDALVMLSVLSTNSRPPR